MTTSIHRNWVFLLCLGTLFVILGLIGLSMAIGLTIASMFFLGVIILIAGTSQIIDAFQSRPWKGTLLHTGIAVLYLFAGFLVIKNPLLASTLFTLFLGMVFVFIGITRASLFFILKTSHGRIWSLLGGGISLLLGILILAQWPYSGLWIIGIFIAIELIINGWFYIFWAISIRRALNPK